MYRSLLLCALIAAPASAQSSAEYRVSFESSWSAATHPAGFPDNAHFSPLVGATHDATVSYWEPGATATSGIEAMAERGQNGAAPAGDVGCRGRDRFCL